MSCFLVKHKILSQSQYGFQQNKSWICTQKYFVQEDALIGFVEFMRTTINWKLRGSALFVYFKKAFDTISHNNLIYKLELFGF